MLLLLGHYFLVSLRSRPDIGFERVDINKNHPSYINVRSDAARKNEYFNERICDEISGYIFHKLMKEEKMDVQDAALFARKLREEGYYAFLSSTSKRRR